MTSLARCDPGISPEHKAGNIQRPSWPSYSAARGRQSSAGTGARAGGAHSTAHPRAAQRFDQRTRQAERRALVSPPSEGVLRLYSPARAPSHVTRRPVDPARTSKDSSALLRLLRNSIAAYCSLLRLTAPRRPWTRQSFGAPWGAAELVRITASYRCCCGLLRLICREGGRRQSFGATRRAPPGSRFGSETMRRRSGFGAEHRGLAPHGAASADVPPAADRWGIFKRWPVEVSF